MAKITVINPKAFAALKAANGSFQRGAVLDAISSTVKDGVTSVEQVMKLSAPKIDAQGTKQDGDYVTRYYLSELHTNRVIDREGSRSGGGGALRAIYADAKTAAAKAK